MGLISWWRNRKRERRVSRWKVMHEDLNQDKPVDPSWLSEVLANYPKVRKVNYYDSLSSTTAKIVVSDGTYFSEYDTRSVVEALKLVGNKYLNWLAKQWDIEKEIDIYES